MLKSLLLGIIVMLALVVSPAWATLGQDGAACQVGFLAQNDYGYTDQYGYDHDQMHYQMHGGGNGGGCGGGGGGLYLGHHHMGNYQNPHSGYQNPNYDNYDSGYQNNGPEGNQYQGGHNH